MTRKQATFITIALILALALTFLIYGSRLTPETPSAPAPTSTSEPTNLPEPIAVPVATDVSEATGADFAPHPNNPVLAPGAPGSWDSETVFNSRVVFKDGIYHMFYNGSSSLVLETIAIGYATSRDGQSFTRHTSSPILEGDETGFDALQVGTGVPIMEDDTWILYYNAGSGPGPGKTIGRATSPNPSGPWTRNREPILVAGRPGEWDSEFIMPDSIIATGGGYVMYYSGGAGWPEGTTAIGMATSPDGLTWTKYDDPGTTDSPFAESDPVLQSGDPSHWDFASVWGCTVLKTAHGWEMLYTGSDTKRVQIGYATSLDGIHWTKFEDNPILTPEIEPMLSEGALPILQSPSVIVKDSTYTVYYDYGVSTGGIGVATGVIPK